MNNPKPIILLLLSLGLLTASSINSKAERLQGYFEQNSGGAETNPKKDGYFFYKDEIPIPPQETVQEMILPTAPKAEKEEGEKTFDGEIPWDEVYTMHPDKFQTLLNDTLKWSLTQPDHERVQKFMTLQYVAMDRADKFQAVWTDILNIQPALDTTVQRAPTATGTRLAVMEKGEDLEKYMLSMRDNMGILMFSRADCPYCAEQRVILESFQERWKWQNIQIIDINESPALAAEYDVNIVPDLFVIGNLNDEILQKRLNTGITTRDVIERSLMEAYSLWFLGRPYTSAMIRQSQEAFDTYMGGLIEESKAKKERSEDALDKFVEKYRSGKGQIGSWRKMVTE